MPDWRFRRFRMNLLLGIELPIRRNSSPTGRIRTRAGGRQERQGERGERREDEAVHRARDYSRSGRLGVSRTGPAASADGQRRRFATANNFPPNDIARHQDDNPPLPPADCGLAIEGSRAARARPRRRRTGPGPDQTRLRFKFRCRSEFIEFRDCDRDPRDPLRSSADGKVRGGVHKRRGYAAYRANEDWNSRNADSIAELPPAPSQAARGDELMRRCKRSETVSSRVIGISANRFDRETGRDSARILAASLSSRSCSDENPRADSEPRVRVGK